MQAAGLDVDQVAPRLSFFFAVGLNFYEEVAKLRAARRLWARMVKEKFKPKKESSLVLRCAVIYVLLFLHLASLRFPLFMMAVQLDFPTSEMALLLCNNTAVLLAYFHPAIQAHNTCSVVCYSRRVLAPRSSLCL